MSSQVDQLSATRKRLLQSAKDRLAQAGTILHQPASVPTLMPLRFDFGSSSEPSRNPSPFMSRQSSPPNFSRSSLRNEDTGTEADSEDPSHSRYRFGSSLPPKSPRRPRAPTPTRASNRDLPPRPESELGHTSDENEEKREQMENVLRPRAPTPLSASRLAAPEAQTVPGHSPSPPLLHTDPSDDIDGADVFVPHAPGYLSFASYGKSASGDGAADTVSPLAVGGDQETDILSLSESVRSAPSSEGLSPTAAHGDVFSDQQLLAPHAAQDDDVVERGRRDVLLYHAQRNRHTSSDEESESTDHQTSLPLSNAVPNAAHIAVTVTEFDSHALRMDDEDADSSHGADTGLLRPRTVHDHDSEDGDDEHSDMRTSSRQSGPPVRPQHETTDDDEHEPDRQLSDTFTQADRAQQQTQLWGELLTPQQQHLDDRNRFADVAAPLPPSPVTGSILTTGVLLSSTAPASIDASVRLSSLMPYAMTPPAATAARLGYPSPGPLAATSMLVRSTPLSSYHTRALPALNAAMAAESLAPMTPGTPAESRRALLDRARASLKTAERRMTTASPQLSHSAAQLLHHARVTLDRTEMQFRRSETAAVTAAAAAAAAAAEGPS